MYFQGVSAKERPQLKGSTSFWLRRLTSLLTIFVRQLPFFVKARKWLKEEIKV